MAYVRGNLAVRPERQQQRTPKYRQTKKTVTRKAALPTREKLLYLFTVLLCAAVAFFIISRYAHIYNANLQVQEMKRATVDLNNEASVLRVEIEKLSEWKRIEQFAKENGLVTPEQPLEIEVYKQVGNE
ncbi:cell division protein FtsL [Paenibacillus apiarius]|uniref:cell division protein FtsL n=1 Tax=Paenibacillus apiarius TaxID=46240 RepID=UPI00197E552F|nr:cell division protein FtsL [Paenibacillus apiarius]MBN3525954.1 cell division protein FtsL [Paenibacillus apiarius]